MSKSFSTILANAALQLNSRREAELLLMQTLQISRSYIIAHPEQLLNAAEQTSFDHLCQRRLAGEPMAYLAGYKDFWTLSLETTTDTLIPRPETELLVELALANLPADQTVHLADLGTGSGAIALSLAMERPLWQLTATDQSAKTLAVCERNRQRLNLNNVQCYQGNWCEALPHHDYAAIISNPPYIADKDLHLDQGDLRFEPKEALIGGEDGLEAFRLIIPESRNYLVANGLLLLEHGFDQALAIRQFLQASGFIAIETFKDLAGLDRVTMGRKIS